MWTRLVLNSQNSACCTSGFLILYVWVFHLLVYLCNMCWHCICRPQNWSQIVVSCCLCWELDLSPLESFSPALNIFMIMFWRSTFKAMSFIFAFAYLCIIIWFLEARCHWIAQTLELVIYPKLPPQICSSLPIWAFCMLRLVGFCFVLFYSVNPREEKNHYILQDG